MASENSTDIRAVSRWLKYPKVVPPLVLLKQVTALLKTWSRVPKRFLTTGFFWDHLQSNQPPISDRTEALLAGVPGWRSGSV